MHSREYTEVIRVGDTQPMHNRSHDLQVIKSSEKSHMTKSDNAHLSVQL